MRQGEAETELLEIRAEDISSLLISLDLVLKERLLIGQLQTFGNSTTVIMAMANAEINRQAAMISYLNDFYMMAIITALSVPLVIFLKRPKGRAEKPDASAMGH